MGTNSMYFTKPAGTNQFVGENEIAAGKYALKNMKTGDQVEVAREELKERISSHA